MRTPRAAAYLTCLALGLLVFGCEMEEAAGTPDTGSPAASPIPSAAPVLEAAAPAPTAAATASAPAVPVPTCPAGLTGNAVPAYCIKLPPTYKVKDARTKPDRGSIEYDTGTTTDHLNVSYESTPLAQLAKDAEGELKFGGDKLEKKGDLPGGGKWFRGTHAEYARIVTIVKGAAPVTFKCSFAYQPKAAPPQAAIDACKSLVLP
jgi:hypothetical protein